MFYYKIIHKNYASNAIVSHFDNTVNRNCIHCNVICDIVHTFVDCIMVKPLWDLALNWLKRIFKLKNSFVLTKRMKLLGLIDNDRINEHFEIDFILLHIKLFIHKCRVQNWKISFIMFLKYLKHEIIIEKLCHVNNIKNLAAIENIENVI